MNEFDGTPTGVDSGPSYPWDGEPVIMGVINSSPESFYADGIQETVDVAVSEARDMIDAGAEIIDIGGEGNSPAAKPLTAEEETARVVPYIERLAELDAMISVDTWKATVAEAALEAGADIVNDVSGFEDEEMLSVIERYGAPVVIMHGTDVIVSETQDVEYDDLMAEIRTYLVDRIRAARDVGIPRENIIIDPGIGFGKSIEQSIDVIARLEELRSLGYPILLGHSRKLTFEHVRGDPEDCLPATIAFTALGVERGANIVRVHDVPENLEALRAGNVMREQAVRRSAND